MGSRYSITPSIAATDKNLSHAEFRLLAILGSYASSKTGWCFPSNRVLAADMGCNERTIQKHLDKLRGLGYIQRRQRRGKSAETRVKMDVDDESLPLSLSDTPLAQTPVTEGHPPLSLSDTHNDSLNDPKKKNGKKPPPEPSSTPNGAAKGLLTQGRLDKWYYELGKRLLGDGAGGQLTKLKNAVGLGEAWVLLAEAEEKQDPREWISAVINRRKMPKDAVPEGQMFT